MASYQPVRAVERIFDILQLMNLRKTTSVSDIHAETGLPKATIVRLLQTLEQLGFVSRDTRQAEYQITSKVMSLSSGFHSDPLIVEAGRLHAIALTQKFTWPMTIAILDNNAVVVRFSTIPDSPISPFHATVNMRLSLNRHGLGLAYLAFCPLIERKVLIEALVQSNAPYTPNTRTDVDMLERQLEKIRNQGFSERLVAPEKTNSNTIAVPIMRDDRVLGTLGVTYFLSAIARPMAIEKFVDPLQNAAREITKSVAKLV